MGFSHTPPGLFYFCLCDPWGPRKCHHVLCCLPLIPFCDLLGPLGVGFCLRGLGDDALRPIHLSRGPRARLQSPRVCLQGTHFLMNYSASWFSTQMVWKASPLFSLTLAPGKGVQTEAKANLQGAGGTGCVCPLHGELPQCTLRPSTQRPGGVTGGAEKWIGIRHKPSPQMSSDSSLGQAPVPARLRSDSRSSARPRGSLRGQPSAAAFSLPRPHPLLGSVPGS